MKHKLLIISLLVTIFMVTMAACGNRADSETESPVVIDNGAVVSEDTAVVDTETTDIANLPPLPRIDSAQSQGLGGGNFAAETEAAEIAASPAVDTADFSIIDPYFTDIFSGTTFILNALLPTDIIRAAVQQQGSRSISLEEARVLADSFGFTGPLYIQPEQIYALEDGVEQERIHEIPTTYFAFDGSRTLHLDAYGMYYYDNAYSYSAAQQLPADELAAKAEQFLTDRNLLDFPFTIERGWGNDMYVYRSIDGRSVNEPEITVSFNNRAEIISVNVQKLTNLTNLGNYPLRSAEEAWQLVQDGVVKNNIVYYYTPIYDEFEAAAVPPIEVYRYWQRSYEPGTEVHLYNWPSVYVPADGTGAPRIETYPLALQAAEADLQAIAVDPFNQFHFWGIVSADGTMLELSGWEIMLQNDEYVFFLGMARRDGDQVLFVTNSGETYILPNAPDDLPEGELLNLFGWGIREGGEAYPIVDWENLELYVEYLEFEEPIAVEPGYPGSDEGVVIEPVEPYFYEPYEYEQFTANSVELVYFYSYIYPEYTEETLYYAPPTIILQPVWKFSGEAENGDQIELFVEAVAPEYLDTTP